MGLSISKQRMNKERRLYRNVLWFNNRNQFDIDFFDYLLPQRIVSNHHRYKNGLFYSEKCKREIQYESGMELSFIKQLETMKMVTFYFEQPVRIPYWRGRRKGVYTPDFGIYLQTGEFVLVEIKDLSGMLEDRVQLKTEALMEFCSKRGFGLLLTDGRNTFSKLLKIRNNRMLEKEILAATDGNILRKRECEEIMQKCNATHHELLKVILKHNLKYKSFPLKLQRGNQNGLFRQVYIERKKYDDLTENRFPTLFKR